MRSAAVVVVDPGAQSADEVSLEADSAHDSRRAAALDALYLAIFAPAAPIIGNQKTVNVLRVSSVTISASIAAFPDWTPRAVAKGAAWLAEQAVQTWPLLTPPRADGPLREALPELSDAL